MKLTIEQIAELEKTAELNDGHCDKCGSTIKIYRYKLSRAHATFLRAMAKAVSESGVNDVDIGTIGIAYSVRSQCTKLRQHGLIARIKNDVGAQIPSRWLITRKGWTFLNDAAIPEKVVVYNNTVLGHEGDLVTIYDVLGEAVDPLSPIYQETPVSAPEARTYDSVRKPKKHMVIKAMYKGKNVGSPGYKAREIYELHIDRLQVGQPVRIILPHERVYNDIAAFQNYWRTL